MLQLMPADLIITYVVFTLFVYYQQLHVKHFRGASKLFGGLLSLFAFAGTVCGFAFLWYYGWTVAWYLPVLLFLISLLAFVLWSAIKVAIPIPGFPYFFEHFGVCRMARCCLPHVHDHRISSTLTSCQ